MRISDWSSDECSSDLQRGRNGWNEVDQGRYRSCWHPLMSTWTVTGVSPRLSQYQPCDPSNGAVNVPDAPLCSRSIHSLGYSYLAAWPRSTCMSPATAACAVHWNQQVSPLFMW